MKTKKYVYILFLLLAISSTSVAQQSKGYVRIKISGLPRPLTKLDNNTLHINDTLIALSKGVHTIKIWEPKTYLIDSSITIKAGDTVKYNFTLKHTAEYIKFKKEITEYYTTRNRRLWVSPIFMGLTIGAGLIVDQVLVQKQYNNALSAKTEYLRTGVQASMDNQKSVFDESKKKYENMRMLEFGIYSFSGILAINYVRIIIKQRKTTEPSYHQEKLLSRVNLNVFPNLQSKTLACNLSLKF